MEYIAIRFAAYVSEGEMTTEINNYSLRGYAIKTVIVVPGEHRHSILVIMERNSSL